MAPGQQAALRLAPPPASPAPASPPPAAASPLWWTTADDPLLARLVDHGLASSAPLACDAAALDEETDRAQAHARHITGRLERLVGAASDEADERARAYAYADQRAHLAAAIGLAYVEVRRWQERLALRQTAADPLRDNAEIARFRREAGLVSGVDGGMAGLLVGLNAGDLDTARTRLAAGLADLARLSGLSVEELTNWLGTDGRVPDLATDPALDAPTLASRRADVLALEQRLVARLARQHVTQADIDAAQTPPTSDTPTGNRKPAPVKKAEATRAARAQSAVNAYTLALARAQDETTRGEESIARASTHSATLERAGQLAERTAGDARLGYRAGTESFATLYVAEAATLAAREARIDARAAQASATISLWTARGEGWTPADLAPAPPKPDRPACD